MNSENKQRIDVVFGQKMLPALWSVVPARILVILLEMAGLKSVLVPFICFLLSYVVIANLRKNRASSQPRKQMYIEAGLALLATVVFLFILLPVFVAFILLTPNWTVPQN